jgi:hypothetical protein
MDNKLSILQALSITFFDIHAESDERNTKEIGPIIEKCFDSIFQMRRYRLS